MPVRFVHTWLGVGGSRGVAIGLGGGGSQDVGMRVWGGVPVPVRFVHTWLWGGGGPGAGLYCVHMVRGGGSWCVGSRVGGSQCWTELKHRGQAQAQFPQKWHWGRVGGIRGPSTGVRPPPPREVPALPRAR